MSIGTPVKKKNSWLTIILLVAGILFIAAVAFFGTKVFSYWQQIQSGTVDLSSFEVSDELTTIENDTEVSTAEGNLYIDNYANDPVKGPENAEITIVAFEDFQCPYCKRAFPIIQSMLARHGDSVKFVYRDFPVSDVHPDAQKSAEAGQCANDQGQFWPYHDKLYINQENLTVVDLKKYAAELSLDAVVFDNCLDTGKYKSEVEEDFNDGLQAGVRGTPTFFVNGNIVSGVISEEGFDQIIEYFKNN